MNRINYHTEWPSVIYERNGKQVTEVIVKTDYGYSCHTLQVYYRHERTWDDHMGNTPCGYYCNVPVNGHRKRVYYGERW